MVSEHENARINTNHLLVITWNIGHGGLDPHTHTDDRFWRQLELINRLTPDILCLQEAWRWDEQGSARLLVFEHATGLRAFLAPAPSVIAVRPPIVRPLKHLPHHEMTCSQQGKRSTTDGE